jgi:hypothetical protein
MGKKKNKRSFEQVEEPQNDFNQKFRLDKNSCESNQFLANN